jgi:hypothetical protein
MFQVEADSCSILHLKTSALQLTMCIADMRRAWESAAGKCWSFSRAYLHHNLLMCMPPAGDICLRLSADADADQRWLLDAGGRYRACCAVLCSKGVV